jgi:PilZ domain-containing protein
MLRVFLPMLALNLGGIVFSVVDRTATVSDATTIALLWSWYNVIVLILACVVCVEQPQRRYRHRFPMHEKIQLRLQDTIYTFPVRDISVSGIRLIGESPLRARQQSEVMIGGKLLQARAARNTEDGFTLAFEPSLRNRAIVIKYVFSKNYLMAFSGVSPKTLGFSIFARLFR